MPCCWWSSCGDGSKVPMPMQMRTRPAVRRYRCGPPRRRTADGAALFCDRPSSALCIMVCSGLLLRRRCLYCRYCLPFAFFSSAGSLAKIARGSVSGSSHHFRYDDNDVAICRPARSCFCELSACLIQKRNHGGRGEQQPPERGRRRGGHGDRRAIVQGVRPEGRDAAAVGGEVPAQAVSLFVCASFGRRGAFFHWRIAPTYRTCGRSEAGGRHCCYVRPHAL